MKRIKIVQIGLGHDHAEWVLKSLIKQSELFDIVGIALPEEEAGFEKTADRYSGIKRMTVREALSLPDLDAAAIETQDERLTEYALLAARRGLSVHMDKAGGFEHSAYKSLIKTVKENKTVFHTGYMYRYNPAVQELFRLIRRGGLGEIYSVEAHMNCLHPDEKRRWLGKFPAGMMYFLGCHLVDLILRLQGIPEEIIPLSTSTGIGGVDTYDCGMAAFKYKNGVSFAKACAAEAGGFYRRQLVVCGSKGTVELRPLEGFVNAQGSLVYTGICSVDAEEAAEKGWQDTRKFSNTMPFERYDLMLESFAKMVRGEEENPYAYDYEEQLHRVLLAACGENIDYKKKTEW